MAGGLWLVLMWAAPMLRPLVAVTCWKCDAGIDCIGDDCEGDYCVITKLQPKLGLHKFGQRRVIKGCLSGTLLKNDIPDHCESVLEDNTEVDSCFCKEHRCNSRLRNESQKQMIEMVECHCNAGEGCVKQKCKGEFCSLTWSPDSKNQYRACINSSIPLIERRGNSAIFQPPFSGSVSLKDLRPDQLLNTQTYLCSSNFCNNKIPPKMNPKMMTCKTSYMVHTSFSQPIHSNVGECEGQYCWRMQIMYENEEDFLRKVNASGCLTLAEGAETSEEMKEQGCVRFDSNKFKLDACFETGGAAATETPLQNEVEEENEDEGEVEKEEEENEAMENQRQEENGKQAENEEKGEENAGAEEPRKSPSDDGNTAIVAVFVVVMVLIVIVGIVWKFELHKRIFRARYESVAG